MNSHKFSSSEALAHGLAKAVAAALRQGIAARGAASVAVSGGKTPLKFFDALSQEKLDWEKVSVTLADERWVPPSSERSNTRLVYAHLLINEATPARFVPLYANFATPEEGMAAVVSGLDVLALPFDAVVLGMGDDGHTASWFPNGDNLAQALDMTGEVPLLPIRAPGAPEPRITFTAPVLLAAKHLFLHFETAQKHSVYDKACEAGPIAEMPIRAALRAERPEPLQVYWCE